MLGETLVALAYGLNHGHGSHGAYMEVGKTGADPDDLAMKDDLFAMGGGDNPLATGLLADGKTVLLQLEEREKIGDCIAHKP